VEVVMDPLEFLRASAVEIVHVPAPGDTGGTGIAWQIHRVRSADLAEYSVAELVGALASDEALREIQAEHRAASADPVKLAAITARAEQAMQDRALREVARNPRLQGQLATREDAWVCAGVRGLALVSSDAPTGVLDPSAVEGLKPCRLVLTEAEVGEGRLWVADVDEYTRAYLHHEIERLSGAATVRPFRGGPGPVAATAPVGS
jgi:hypothetical protein